MRQTQITDPQDLKEFLLLHQDFLRPKFADAKYTSKKGRPRIGLRWVIIAICVFSRVHNIVWRDLSRNLKLCDFLIEEGYLSRIPSKSTFHGYWDQTTQSSLKSWIRMTGYSLTSDIELDTAIDGSGFELLIGKIWRLVKWGKRAILKTSTIFCKVHLAVALPSRAIVGIETSKSTVHDSVMFGPVWKNMYTRLKNRIKRTHLDKGYWGENIVNSWTRRA